MLHILKLSMMAVMLQNPELMNAPVNPSGAGIAQTAEAKMTETKLNFAMSQNHINSTLQYERMHVEVVVLLATLTITMLLIYGAIKGKPSYLMPFFCLQLFDLSIACLTAMSSICYLPDMHRVIQDNPRLPMQPNLLKLSPHVLAFVVLIAFTVIMFIKAYLVGIVWACYRYLTLRSLASARTSQMVNDFVPESPPPDIQDLLPDYETACTKSPPLQPQQPPSYSQVFEMPPPQYPGLVEPSGSKTLGK